MHLHRIYIYGIIRDDSYILTITWSHAEKQQDMRVYLYYITYVATHGFIKERKNKQERTIEGREMQQLFRLRRRDESPKNFHEVRSNIGVRNR